MREVELKSVVDDIDRRRALVEQAGGKLEFDGRLLDRRYGDSAGRLMLIDHVLRLRVYETAKGREGQLAAHPAVVKQSHDKCESET